jgi:hypothetical protein
MLAREGRMRAGYRRQVRAGRCDGLDARLLIVGDDRHRIAWRRLRRRPLQDFHLAIDAQHFGHFCRELGIAALQIVAHLVRLHVVLVEQLAHRALRQVGEAAMPLRGPMCAGVAGKKPCRPQFVRIAELLGLAAGQIDQPCPGLDRDDGLAARPRAIIECRPSTTARSTQRWTVW